MKKRYLWLPIFLALSLTLAACAPKSTPTPTAEAVSAAITLTDGLEREITLEGPAQKIVSMAPSNTEILFAIGAGAQVIGRDDFSNYPAETADIVSIGGTSGYNFEQITNLQPDLVLAAGINSPEDIKAIEDLGITVYLLPNPIDLNGMYANLKTVGILSGHEAEAEALAKSLQERVQVVEEKIASAEGQPAVFYELDGTDPAKPWTSGPGTFISTLIDMAGGKNIADSLDGAWAQISQEELLKQDPQVILLGDAAYGTTPEMVSERPGWNEISAVQNNRVFAFNDDLVSRPGPRLVDGLEALAQAIHPEVYP